MGKRREQLTETISTLKHMKRCSFKTGIGTLWLTHQTCKATVWLLAWSQVHSFIFCLHLFQAIMQSYVRNCMACKAENSYSLTLYRKSSLTSWPREKEIKWYLDIIFHLSDCQNSNSLKTLLQDFLIHLITQTFKNLLK